MFFTKKYKKIQENIHFDAFLDDPRIFRFAFGVSNFETKMDDVLRDVPLFSNRALLNYIIFHVVPRSITRTHVNVHLFKFCKYENKWRCFTLIMNKIVI